MDYDAQIELRYHPENFDSQDQDYCPYCGEELSSTGYCSECLDYPFNQIEED